MEKKEAAQYKVERGRIAQRLVDSKGWKLVLEILKDEEEKQLKKLRIGDVVMSGDYQGMYRLVEKVKSIINQGQSAQDYINNKT